MQLSRRGLLGGLLAVVSAPAIVRVESLMPVRAEIIRPSLLIETTGFKVGDIVSWEGGKEFVVTQINNSTLSLAAIELQLGSTLEIRLPNEAFA